MAAHTQKGSVSIDAFQWTGGTGATLVAMTLPIWAKRLALHAPGDGSLSVPSRSGTEKANATDWVLQDADGSITIMANSVFTLLYN